MLIPNSSRRYWQTSGLNGLLPGGFPPLSPLVPLPIAEHRGQLVSFEVSERKGGYVNGSQSFA